MACIAAARWPSRNKIYKMTPGFWRLARRERGAYPQRSGTSEQRRQRPKRPANLSQLESDLELAQFTSIQSDSPGFQPRLNRTHPDRPPCLPHFCACRAVVQRRRVPLSAFCFCLAAMSKSTGWHKSIRRRRGPWRTSPSPAPRPPSEFTLVFHPVNHHVARP